jgi:hypothetical protein
MSDDSVPFALPLPRFAPDSCETTVLYRDLCFDTWYVWEYPAMKHRTSFRKPFLACNGTWLRAGHKRTFAAGYFASHTITPETARITLVLKRLKA